VKPYVKSNKNDTIDAAAIAEAVTRPTMRFVPIKHTEQVDLQALHRSRDLSPSCRLYVSRGVGMSILPIRFSARPEVVVLEL